MPNTEAKLEIIVGGNAESAMLALYDLGYKAESAGERMTEALRAVASPITSLIDRVKEFGDNVSERAQQIGEDFLGIRIKAEEVGEGIAEGADVAAEGLGKLAERAGAVGPELDASTAKGLEGLDALAARSAEIGPEMDVAAAEGAEGLEVLGLKARETGVRVAEAGAEAGEAEGIFSKLGELGAMAGGWIGLAFGVEETGKEFVKLGGEYEQNLNLISALTKGNHDTSLSMDQIKSGLDRLTPQFTQYGYSTAEASEGLATLIKAGHSAKDSMQELVPSLQLARATQIDAGEASEMMSETLNTFNLKASDAQSIADAMSQAFHQGTMSIGDLTYSLKYVGTQAHASGLSLQQTNALLVELSKHSIKGSSAGTGLKDVLLNLEAPTTAAATELTKLGVNVYDSSGKMQGMGSIISQLQDKMSGLTQQQQIAAEKIIFGKVAIQAASTIIGDGAGKFDMYTAAMSKSGSAAEAAKAKTAGFSGAVNRMTAMIESGMENLYIKVAPALAKGLTTIIDGVQWVATAVGTMVDKFHLVAGARLEIALISKAVQVFWKSFVNSGGVKAIEGAFGDIQKAIGKLGGVINGQLLPWFRKLLPTIQPIVVELGKLWAKAFEFIKVVMDTAIAVISFTWAHFGKYILDVITIAWNLVAGVVMGAFKILEGVFDFFDGLFTGNWSKMWRGLGEILQGAWKIIVSVFKSLLQLLIKTVTVFIPELFSAGINLIEGLFNGISSMGGWLAGKIGSFIKSSVTGPVKSLLGIFSPSRVFAGFGMNTALGFAQGVDDHAHKAVAAVVRMTNKVTTAVQNSNVLKHRKEAHHKHHRKTHHKHEEDSSGSYKSTDTYAQYPLHVTVNVAGNVWTEKQLAKALVTDMRDELLVLARRNGGRTGL